MKTKFKIFNLSLAAALIFSILISMVSFDAKCENLRDNVLRLHIIANSDSKSDQTLKLRVRDAILEESEQLFLGADTLDDAIVLTKQNIPKIEKIAKDTIKKEGYDYGVSVKVDESFFGTRVYDDFTLPAGVYEALKIEIGKAEGKNWWCVLFPSICVGAAGDLSDSASDGAVKIAKGGSRFIIRFKIVELYETVKNYFLR